VTFARRVDETALVSHFRFVSGADFSADGRWIVTSGPISAGPWRTEAGQLLDYLRGHTALLTMASFAPSGYRVVATAQDGTVRTYDCRKSATRRPCRPRSKPARGGARSAHGFALGLIGVESRVAWEKGIDDRVESCPVRPGT
jgi:WD40 repeat protein